MFVGWKSAKSSMPASKIACQLQRGNVSLTNLQVLNAILYVAEQGCKWRGFQSGSPSGGKPLHEVD
jgi:hypothetical protein